jgi:hypothetical protein
MIMAWLAVDENGNEYIYSSKPSRDYSQSWNCCWAFEAWEDEESLVQLPKGTIKKLIGRELAWNDEPIELKEDE